MPCASFSILDGPGGRTGCDVPVRSCWDRRDVIVAAVFDCFNTAILGSRGEHVTPRPPRPTIFTLKSQNRFRFIELFV